MTPAILTGMTAEARIARRAGLPVACSGVDPYAVAQRLLDEGAAGLISFGIAGGLAPLVTPGTLVVATAVIGDEMTIPASADWRHALLGALPQARAGAIVGASRPAVTVEDKAGLHARTGALAVDLESYAVARACRERGRPFAVLRAVADPAGRALPPAALTGLDGEGKMAPGAVLGQVLRDPGQLIGLCRLGLDLARAMAALNAAARAFPRGLLRLDPLQGVGDVA